VLFLQPMGLNWEYRLTMTIQQFRYPDQITWAVVRTENGSSAIAMQAVTRRTLARHTKPWIRLEHTGHAVDYITRPWGIAWDGARMSASEMRRLRDGVRRQAEA
jgi:hypothetical protein